MNRSFKTFGIALFGILLLFASSALGQSQAVPAATPSGPAMGAAPGTAAVGPCTNCPNPNCPNCPKAMGQEMGPGMMQGGMGMGHRGHGGGMGMMHGGMGMKGGMMGMPGGHFYLNQAQQLGLSPQQIQQLQSIRNNVRRQNIPLMAQMRVIKINMQELVNSANWSVDQAQQLVQQMTQTGYQMMSNRLQALKQAQQVLTPQQRQMAGVGEIMSDSMDEEQ